jgi:hypothetical protein
MNTKQQLLQSINETEQQLNKLKQELESHKTPTIQEASVGDTLEDGSIVIKKENGLALLLAPAFTEIRCTWSKDFSKVFESLKNNGFNSSQWFIPTVEQLRLAYKVIPDEFNKEWYWSSSECIASGACRVCFNFVAQCTYGKSGTFCVRSVRCVSY